MIRDVAVHGTNDANIVDQGSGLLEQLADGNTALSAMPKLKRRAHDGTRLALGGQAETPCWFAMQTVEHRFGVERVDLRRPALDEEVHDVLRCRCEVGRFWRQRVEVRNRAGSGRRVLGLEPAVVGQDTYQSEQTESRARSFEQLASRQAGGQRSIRLLAINHCFVRRQSTKMNSFVMSIA